MHVHVLTIIRFHSHHWTQWFQGRQIRPVFYPAVIVDVVAAVVVVVVVIITTIILWTLLELELRVRLPMSCSCATSIMSEKNKISTHDIII